MPVTSVVRVFYQFSMAAIYTCIAALLFAPMPLSS